MNDRPAIRAEFRGTIGKFALDAGFTAPAKGVTALFGPSGCGKTTVLRCLAGLLCINGVCEIGGEVWQDENGAFLPTHKRPLGYVFQEASLFQHLSVRRNLLFGAPRRDGGGAKVAIAFDEVAELLGVERLLDRSPRNLSGGERQRVAIGRALLLFAWMAFIYFQFVPRSELTSPTYWFMMQIGMVLGFIASFPANWYLVRAGVKPVM